jgi:hypothetical protein
MVKHRQLACQVGAFSGFASESFADLNNMIFLAKTTFVFRSWIYEADGDGKLHSCLLIDSGLHGGLTDSTTAVHLLAKEFS